MVNDSFKVRLANWETEQSKLKVIRYQVFVVEQRVPEELEWDGIDPQCKHVIAEQMAVDLPIGTGRLLPDGHIGRMAVLQEWRGKGVGKALMVTLMELASNQGLTEVLLNAQVHAIEFYRQFGFSIYGESYLDAGIPHIAMKRPL